jgi:hypothetical protein
MPTATDTRITLVFTEDAVFAGGVPVNFHNASLRLPVSPLIRSAEISTLRRRFRHCRLGELGDRPGYLVLGLAGEPSGWLSCGGKIPHSAIQDLQTILAVHPRLKILLDHSGQRRIRPSFWTQLDDFMARLNLDPTRFVLLLSAGGMEERYARHRLARGQAASNRVIAMDLFLIYAAAEWQAKQASGTPDAPVSEAEVETLRRAVRPHKFLTPSRQPRWHRFLLAMMLRQLGMQEQGIRLMPNLANAGDWREETRLLAQHGSRMDRPTWEALKAVQETTLAELPWKSGEAHKPDDSAHTASNTGIGRQDFLDSYIHITTECSFEGEANEVSITDRTCLAIASLQPFIVFGTSCIHAALERHGFAPATQLNLAYDAEFDVGRRLDGLHRNLAALRSMPLSELHGLYHDNLPGLVHNRERLFEMPRVLGDVLADRLRARLGSN